MKKLALLSVFLALPLLLPGQTAKVIQLSPEDAKQAATLYAKKADIEKQIDALHVEITQKYISKEQGWLVFSSNPWSNGFEYSDDFKFIVPKGANQSGGISSVPVTPTYTIQSCPYYPYYYYANPVWTYSTGTITVGITSSTY